VRRTAWYELHGSNACRCRTSTSPPCIRRRRVRHTRRTCTLAVPAVNIGAGPSRDVQSACVGTFVGALALDRIDRIDRGRSPGPPICNTAGWTGGARIRRYATQLAGPAGDTRRTTARHGDSTHIHISDRRPKQQLSRRASGDGAGPSALTLLHSIATAVARSRGRDHRPTATAASNAHSFTTWGFGGRGAGIAEMTD
jgi:hypothetical protein